MLFMPATPFHLLDAAMADRMRFRRLTPDCRIDASKPRLEDKDTHYALSVSAPGVAAHDLEIEAVDERLSIKGETVTATHTHFLNYTVALPADADADSASAISADGLLVVTLPKKVVASPTRVVVSADAEASDKETADTDNERPYKLTMVATGIAAADLDVSFEAHGVLKVSGETKRTGAKIARSFKLPRDADASRAAASHVDGILTIVVPKTIIEPKRIAICISTGGVGSEPSGEDIKMEADHEADAVAAPPAEAAAAEEEDAVMV